MRVLLVEQDPERAVLVRAALGEAGYTVVAQVTNASELLAAVRVAQPDVIIIDRDSPDRDTLEHVCVITRDEPMPLGSTRQVPQAVKRGRR